eukprot:tig00020801_g13967.t1
MPQARGSVRRPRSQSDGSLLHPTASRVPASASEEATRLKLEISALTLQMMKMRSEAEETRNKVTLLEAQSELFQRERRALRATLTTVRTKEDGLRKESTEAHVKLKKVSDDRDELARRKASLEDSLIIEDETRQGLEESLEGIVNEIKNLETRRQSLTEELHGILQKGEDLRRTRTHKNLAKALATVSRIRGNGGPAPPGGLAPVAEKASKSGDAPRFSWPKNPLAPVPEEPETPWKSVKGDPLPRGPGLGMAAGPRRAALALGCSEFLSHLLRLLRPGSRRRHSAPELAAVDASLSDESDLELEELEGPEEEEEEAEAAPSTAARAPKLRRAGDMRAVEMVLLSSSPAAAPARPSVGEGGPPNFDVVV